MRDPRLSGLRRTLVTRRNGWALAGVLAMLGAQQLAWAADLAGQAVADATRLVLEARWLLLLLIAFGLALGLTLSGPVVAMFAGASQLQVLTIRYQFGQWGPPWAALLFRASQAAWEAGRRELALDLADWLAGVVDRLAPFLITDPLARDAARPGLAWQIYIWTAIGDEQAAGRAREALRILESRGGPSS